MMIGNVFVEPTCLLIVLIIAPCFCIGAFHDEIKEHIRHFFACCFGNEF